MFLLLDGDLGPNPDSVLAFMKQKHRMIWERRHGPVGSGMKDESDEIRLNMIFEEIPKD